MEKFDNKKLFVVKKLKRTILRTVSTNLYFIQ